MTKSPKKKQPPQEADAWEDDILKDVEIKAIPFEYIKDINIVFSSGEELNIKIDQSEPYEDIEDYLEQIMEEREDEIDGVDFNLNTTKVKKDMAKLTKRFLKKRK